MFSRSNKILIIIVVLLFVVIFNYESFITKIKYALPTQYNWRSRMGWRPYYWGSYPYNPIWTPAKSDNSELITGSSVQPIPYLSLDTDCQQFAEQQSRGKPYAHFEFRRNYAKCMAQFA